MKNYIKNIFFTKRGKTLGLLLILFPLLLLFYTNCGKYDIKSAPTSSAAPILPGPTSGVTVADADSICLEQSEQVDLIRPDGRKIGEVACEAEDLRDQCSACGLEYTNLGIVFEDFNGNDAQDANELFASCRKGSNFNEEVIVTASAGSNAFVNEENWLVECPNSEVARGMKLEDIYRATVYGYQTERYDWSSDKSNSNQCTGGRKRCANRCCRERQVRYVTRAGQNGAALTLLCQGAHDSEELVFHRDNAAAVTIYNTTANKRWGLTENSETKFFPEWSGRESEEEEEGEQINNFHHLMGLEQAISGDNDEITTVSVLSRNTGALEATENQAFRNLWQENTCPKEESSYSNIEKSSAEFTGGRTWGRNQTWKLQCPPHYILKGVGQERAGNLYIPYIKCKFYDFD